VGNSQSCQGVETTSATGSREVDTTDQTVQPAMPTKSDDFQPETMAERCEFNTFIVSLAKYRNLS